MEKNDYESKPDAISVLTLLAPFPLSSLQHPPYPVGAGARTFFGFSRFVIHVRLRNRLTADCFGVRLKRGIEYESV